MHSMRLSSDPCFAIVPYRRVCRLDGMDLRRSIIQGVWWWTCDRCGRVTPNIVPEHAPAASRVSILSRYTF